VLVNGLPGIVSWAEDGTVLSVMRFTVVNGRISDIVAINDPSRLAAIDVPDPV
jgi:RNA polymerase sigma-70 factor (ECF subfamily)